VPRTFIYLYASIVIAIVCIGLAVDQLWKTQPQIGVISSIEEGFIYLLEDKAKGTLHNYSESMSDEEKKIQLHHDIKNIALNLQISLDIISISDFARSRTLDKLVQGDVVSVVMDDSYFYYKIIGNEPYILQIKAIDYESSRIEFNVFLVIFYLAIAGVIYVLILPLSRDLKKIEKKISENDVLGIPVEVVLHRRSVMFSLANAYNKMSQRLHVMMTAQKEMTSAISHELRTPLARMKFSLEVAKNKLNMLPGKENVIQNIESAKKDIHEMEALIRTLLNYATFEHDHNISKSNGDLAALMSDKITLLNKKDSIVINFHTCGDVHNMCCDWRLMDIVITNLLGNSLRYTNQQIFITLSKLEKNNGFFEHTIIVEDDGVGVAKENRHTIFNAFVRLHHAAKKDSSGFGLGLALVKRIVEWHSGEVFVDDSELGGARFVVRWIETAN